MEIKPVEELKTAFTQWRRSKRYKRESIPDVLITRARELAVTHGVHVIAKATRLPCKRISQTKTQRGVTTRITPVYSRVQMSAPMSNTASPIAEVEVPNGVKLRIFSITPETVSLLSSFCSLRGGA